MTQSKKLIPSIIVVFTLALSLSVFALPAFAETGQGLTVMAEQSPKPGDTRIIKKGTQLVDWQRIYGNTGLDTMQEIVKKGWQTSDVAIIATKRNFKDALAASGLAGLTGAPILISDYYLSSKTKETLKRLKPKTVYIIGGTAALSSSMENDVRKICGEWPIRLGGKDSANTSALICTARRGYAKTAIIARNDNFKDALSVSPVAYAKKMPILLADKGKSLQNSVIFAMKNSGITNYIIVGGTSAVSTNVEAQLNKAGFKKTARLGGKNAAETSKLIAQWGIENGMNADKLGVATSLGYTDALCGGAFCGKNNSVLILADHKNTLNTTFASEYKTKMSKAFTFGGPLAVKDSVLTSLKNSTKALQDIKQPSKSTPTPSYTYQIILPNGDDCVYENEYFPVLVKTNDPAWKQDKLLLRGWDSGSINGAGDYCDVRYTKVNGKCVLTEIGTQTDVGFLSRRTFTSAGSRELRIEKNGKTVATKKVNVKSTATLNNERRAFLDKKVKELGIDKMKTEYDKVNAVWHYGFGKFKYHTIYDDANGFMQSMPHVAEDVPWPFSGHLNCAEGSVMAQYMLKTVGVKSECQYGGYLAHINLKVTFSNGETWTIDPSPPAIRTDVNAVPKTALDKWK